MQKIKNKKSHSQEKVWKRFAFGDSDARCKKLSGELHTSTLSLTSWRSESAPGYLIMHVMWISREGNLPFQ